MCQAHRREELEEQYKHTLLEAIGTRSIPKPSASRPKLQVWTCIDDRNESLRRHLEDANPTNIETLGVAGFFGVPVKYRPINGREPTTLAPVGNHPEFELVEHAHPKDSSKMDTWLRRRKLVASAALWWENLSFLPVVSLVSSVCLAPVAISRLLLLSFAPNAIPTMVGAFRNTLLPGARTTFELPFPREKAAQLLSTVFTDIGTRARFAPLVVVLGHGSSSVNNPFYAAYQCGACRGRDGSTNARLLARLANDEQVRRILAVEYNIRIPADTRFVGGGHNTSTDTVKYFDQEDIPKSHQVRFEQARRIIERACGKNAMERCQRFLLDKPASPDAALRYVETRAINPAEIRPELNHATNGGVVVGRRDLTKGRFLDRRAFLVSYDPYADDDRGTSLQRVLTPALVVCSGINLEYLFSTVDVDHGVGTKVPLNVVGNVGVMQGTIGDLRPGLPSQMTEM